MLGRRGVRFCSQLRVPLICADQEIGWYVLDFLVEEKVVLELKVGSRFQRDDYRQVRNYLQLNKVGLGILVLFGTSKVVFHRVLPPIPEANM
jgi:GxxExxY protein